MLYYPIIVEYPRYTDTDASALLINVQLISKHWGRYVFQYVRNNKMHYGTIIYVCIQLYYN